MPLITADELKRLEPIANLAADQIAELAGQTEIRTAPAGTTLFKSGDEANQYYWLIGGTLRLADDNGTVTEITSGSDDALRPVAHVKPRRHTVTAVKPALYIKLDADLIDAMIAWSQLAMPEPEVIMTDTGVFTVDKASWLKKMVKSPTFKNLPPANIEQLLDKMEPIQVSAGQVIIRQGDPGDYFYMIDQGSALVNRQTEAEEEESIELAELVEGSSFGEAALISDKPRNATVSMMSDGVLLRLSKADFLKLLTEPNVQWIDYSEAKKRVAANKAKWLDIRMASEYTEGHIANALNIGAAQLHRRARELDKSISYICYCDTGQRSSAASFILKQYGVTGYVLRNGTQSIPPEDLVK